MERMGSLLALFAWAVSGIALGQGTPTTLPAPAVPVVPPEIVVQPSQEPGGKPAPTGDQPAAPADVAKTAATLQELAKSVEALSKNLTVVTGDEQIKLVLGGIIN